MQVTASQQAREEARRSEARAHEEKAKVFARVADMWDSVPDAPAQSQRQAAPLHSSSTAGFYVDDGQNDSYYTEEEESKDHHTDVSDLGRQGLALPPGGVGVATIEST